MVNQINVHAKIDNLNYAWLKQESLRDGIAVNRIINRAIALYVELQQSRRHHEAFGQADKFAELCEKLRLKSVH